MSQFLDTKPVTHPEKTPHNYLTYKQNINYSLKVKIKVNVRNNQMYIITIIIVIIEKPKPILPCVNNKNFKAFRFEFLYSFLGNHNRISFCVTKTANRCSKYLSLIYIVFSLLGVKQVKILNTSIHKDYTSSS